MFQYALHINLWAVRNTFTNFTLPLRPPYAHVTMTDFHIYIERSTILKISFVLITESEFNGQSSR